MVGLHCSFTGLNLRLLISLGLLLYWNVRLRGNTLDLNLALDLVLVFSFGKL